MPADPLHPRDPGHDHEEDVLSPSERTELDDDRDEGDQPRPLRRPGGSQGPPLRHPIPEPTETSDDSGLDEMEAESFPASDPPSH